MSQVSFLEVVGFAKSCFEFNKDEIFPRGVESKMGVVVHGIKKLTPPCSPHLMPRGLLLTNSYFYNCFLLVSEKLLS